ncbi:Hypp2563 [Branchiostoma lanceolatum]|uniref:Hypp2563 protein n=1 Tax=Branchiostoma lanceolatum TaxID=7740 RepID=A0A8K0EQI0_BRALA|nr:Hypp2563 [Branchiostoma lanceolatum]
MLMSRSSKTVPKETKMPRSTLKEDSWAPQERNCFHHSILLCRGLQAEDAHPSSKRRRNFPLQFNTSSWEATDLCTVFQQHFNLHLLDIPVPESYHFSTSTLPHAKEGQCI